MAGLDFLFSGEAPPNVNSTTTSTTSMPDWYQEYVRGLLGKSNAIAATDYTPYPGQRVADFTDPTQQSFSMTASNVGVQDPAFNQAQSNFNNVSDGYNPTAVSQYTNPYIAQMDQSIANQANQNLFQNVLPGVNDTFTSAGQFGGSRNAQFTNNAILNNQQAISNSQATANNQAYQNSMQNYLQGNAQQLTAGQDLTQLGTQQNQIGLQQAAAMNAVGQQQQTQAQQGLDVGYQNFVDQRDWSKNQAAFMNQQVRGFNPPTSTASTYAGPGTTYQPSPLAQLASSASTGMAINSLLK